MRELEYNSGFRNHTFSLAQSCAQQYDNNNSVGSKRGRRYKKTGVDSGETSHKRFDDKILLIDRPCTENHGRRRQSPATGRLVPKAVVPAIHIVVFSSMFRQ